MTEKFTQKSKVLLLINCEPLFYADRSSVLTSWVTVAMFRLYENVHYLSDVVTICGTHSNSAGASPFAMVAICHASRRRISKFFTVGGQL
jgi:hypothetical protein